MKKLDFMQLSEFLNYPAVVRAALSTAHASAVASFSSTYTGTYAERRKIVDVINCISYLYMSGDTLPISWDIERPYEVLQFVDLDTDIKKVVGDIYINSEKDIDWRNVPKHTDEETVTQTHKINYRPIENPDPIFIPTDKSDLYIQPPKIPRFDYADKRYSGMIDGVQYTVYASLPKIPTKQNEISLTTDLKLLSDEDLLKLYPNVPIKTRSHVMYEAVEGLQLDATLGLILPIEGFTKAQLVDNLVKYPHLFRLHKQLDDSIVSFYTTIEIDGELHKISEIWSSLPESAVIPYTREFVKEYVVRRYLLERDVHHVDHQFKMYGELDPYLTLFMPADAYEKLGYDTVETAKSCVRARVRYKESRNPVIRRLLDV